MNQFSTHIPMVGPSRTIHETMEVIDHFAKGIALVVNEKQYLIGTITDGDIRRAILAGIEIETPVADILATKSSYYSQPVTAPVGTDTDSLLRLMKERFVRHVPLCDSQGRVSDLVTLDDLLPDNSPKLQAVVMAGGFGTRLKPLTDDLPKPMLPIGNKPILELIIGQLRQAGIQRVSVTTHYQSEKIQNYFGDGRSFGVDITYIKEDSPLGTAGALGLMKTPEEPLLVINGDILTRVDFRAMMRYHKEQGSDLTVAVGQYDMRVPYGVVECHGTRVSKISEKPIFRFFVNAGIYLLEPSAHHYIPGNSRFDMTELIKILIEAGKPVTSFPIVEYWLDIGHHDDYKKAQEDMRNGEL